MDDTPIFLQLSMERAPEWYYPVPVDEVTFNGRPGYRLVGNWRDIMNMPTPPWLVKRSTIYQGPYAQAINSSVGTHHEKEEEVNGRR